jgi:hypothetical protein
MARIVLPTEREIWTYAQQIPIATKDYGIAPIKPWGTQQELLRRILAGKSKGINQFIILKARQVGASTFLLLLTLHWLQRFPGSQGVTVTDSAENKEYFRDLFLGMIEAAGKTGPDADTPTVDEHDAGGLRTRNQVQLVWHNLSRLLLQVCGPRTWGRLGVGRGLSFCHGTEVGLWAQGLKATTYLRSAFSEVNPASLYVFESTARGKNWFYDLWDSAVRAKTIDAVFLSWWLREDNRIKKTQRRLFDVYGSPTLSGKEHEWDRILRRREHVTLDVEQWAWHRWYVEEKAGGSHRLADQEMPTVWEDAFSATQQRPFLDTVTEDRLAASTCDPAAAYVYRWGATMEETVPEVAGTRPPMLRVWTPPDTRPVVVAAVPGHSTMTEDPTWVISVWAASLDEDKLEQVAEFATELNLGLAPFAWCCLHLAGAYGAQHKTFILEISGLGSGVLTEIRRLINTGYGTTRTPGFLDVVNSVRHYIWRRPDSLSASGAYQWKSNAETQAMALQRLRDSIQRGTITIRSEELAEELARLEGKGDGYTPMGDVPRGHRAMAAALAVESYIAQLYPSLKRYRTRGQPASSVGGRALTDFFANLSRR